MKTSSARTHQATNRKLGIEVLEHRAMMSVSDAPAAIATSSTIAPPDVDLVGPTINSIKVGSSVWTQAFKEFIDPTELEGYSLRQLVVPSQSLPWQEVDKVYIQFSENVVSLTNDKVLITGVQRSDYTGSFHVDYDAARFVAVISFNNFVHAERLRLVILDTVTDASGNRLDGEWNNGLHPQQSGNGTAGGNFNLRLNMLPGDISGNGSVLSNDITLAVNAQGRSTTQSSSYDPRYDLDGSGECTQFEVQFVRGKRLSVLPAFEPPEFNPPASAVQVANEPVASVYLKEGSVAQSISTVTFIPVARTEWEQPTTIVEKTSGALGVQEKAERSQPMNYGIAPVERIIPLTIEATTQVQLISRVEAVSDALVNIAPFISIALTNDAPPGNPVVSRAHRLHITEVPIVVTSDKKSVAVPTLLDRIRLQKQMLNSAGANRPVTISSQRAFSLRYPQQQVLALYKRHDE